MSFSEEHLSKKDRNKFEDYVLALTRGRKIAVDELTDEELVAFVALNKWSGYRLPDGLARKKGIDPLDFDLHTLGEGIIVEFEHTNDPALALEITLSHLVEDEKYYTKLAKAGL